MAILVLGAEHSFWALREAPSETLRVDAEQGLGGPECPWADSFCVASLRGREEALNPICPLQLREVGMGPPPLGLPTTLSEELCASGHIAGSIGGLLASPDARQPSPVDCVHEAPSVWETDPR